MVRRDYIIRAIEEFGAMLAKITGLAGKADWAGAKQDINEQCRRLTGAAIDQLDNRSDTELLSSLIEHEPLLTVDTKVMLLAAFLKASGDMLIAQDEVDLGRVRYLKGMHLLLNLGPEGPFHRPDFAPKIETFVAALKNDLPVETQLLLMRHYEQSGQFGKAQDILLAFAETAPGPELVEFGEAFYSRLLAHTDSSLAAGDLARAEAKAGQQQFRSRTSREERN